MYGVCYVEKSLNILLDETLTFTTKQAELFAADLLHTVAEPVLNISHEKLVELVKVISKSYGILPFHSFTHGFHAMLTFKHIYDRGLNKHID
jgi:hypothetical protein